MCLEETELKLKRELLDIWRLLKFFKIKKDLKPLSFQKNLYNLQQHMLWTQVLPDQSNPLEVMEAFLMRELLDFVHLEVLGERALCLLEQRQRKSLS